ncbi:N-6 DNA methylase [Curtobacterium sp. 24E2]|nr:SAM-dependent DNA methyltransferase [Curtobacterium sp. 24E2]
MKPEYADAAAKYLSVKPATENLLRSLSIGEVSACYEALLATLDSGSRKESGQFFTPDDAASFMAGYSREFPEGIWLDPCCGVGNLAWHLVAVQDDPSDFLKNRLVLSDRDDVALRSAVALLAAEFGNPQDDELLGELGGGQCARISSLQSA